MARLAERLRRAFVPSPPPRRCPLCKTHVLPGDESITIAERAYHVECAQRFGARFRVD